MKVKGRFTEGDLNILSFSLLLLLLLLLSLYCHFKGNFGMKREKLMGSEPILNWNHTF